MLATKCIGEWFKGSMFASRKPKPRRPSAPDGLRIYAVADVHGRLDLLNELLSEVENDSSRRGPSETALIFLGDIIDRGPDSNGVVERLRNYRHGQLKPYFITGNHEEVLLGLLSGEAGLLFDWLRFGGRECLQSYGVDLSEMNLADEKAALCLIQQRIPEFHAEFLRSFRDSIGLGDYFFVHAGVRPGIELARQRPSDLRWIRLPFLEDKNDHGAIIVHGHTICDEVEFRSNRIGLDTGAYRTGKLTALGLEGEDQWLIATG